MKKISPSLHICLPAFLLLVCLTAGTGRCFANTYNVTQTSDGHAATQLRGAIEAADAAGPGPHTINIPAGTYNLTLGEISFGNSAQNISIVGAGSGVTIINMTSTLQDRIMIINPPGTIANVVTSISGIKFTNGLLTSDVYGGGAIICGGPGNITNITNCVFDGNKVGKSSSYGGGAINMQGGGGLNIDQCTFSNNSTGSVAGGAIDVFFLSNTNLTGSVSITNCNFTGNSAAPDYYGAGGAVAITTQDPDAGQTFPSSLLKNTFTNNSVADGITPTGGGAIYIESSYPTVINYNRFTGNKTAAIQDALCVEDYYGSSVDATNNWWGSNDDPADVSSTPRQTAYINGTVGTATLTTSPRLVLKTTATKATVCQGPANTTLVTASFLSNSAGGTVTAANLARIIGLPVAFSAVNGSLSGAQGTIQSNGSATVTFTGNVATGNSSVSAVVDNVTTTDAFAKVPVTVSTAPVIPGGSQPVSLVSCPGSTASFAVAVTSAATPAYQWYKGTAIINNGSTGTGSSVSGATAATLSIAGAGNADAASYKCIITNACGSVTSSTAALSFIPSRLYVAVGGAGNGSSWASPLGSLTDALAVASSCSGTTEIWVKSGTYYPSANPYGVSTVLLRDHSFYLLNGVGIYGGFSGTETAVAQRNIAANPTILSGDIGTAGDASDNCFHVVVSASNNSTARLDGFTITNGNANYTIGGDASYRGVNVSRVSGGGIIMSASSATITNCTVISNSASAGGGGLYQNSGTVKMSNCVFTSNTAAYGGAVRNDNTPSLTLINSAFSNNSTTQSGAAMSLFQGRDTLANNIFVHNYDHSTTQGGGALCVSTADFYIADNTFYADTTTGHGGAIRSESASGSLQLYNNIFYGNKGILGDDDVNNITTAYTQASNSFSATNPLFINSSDADGADNIWGTTDDGLHLLPSSPGFDGGDNSKVPAGISTDITGVARVQNGRVNMGAYESGSYPFSVVYVDSSKPVAGDGSSWASALQTVSAALQIAHIAGNVDSILVAKGTYYPTGAQSTTNRDSAFVITRGGLKIYGGYAAGGGARNINANPTYLDGNTGSSSSTTDNSYHIMIAAGIGSGEDSLIIDGFTFRNGLANGPGSKTYNGQTLSSGGGAGIYMASVNNGQATVIRNCTFSNGAALNGGGGLFQAGGKAVVANCVFSGNSASYGGAVRNEGTPLLTVINSVFSSNISSQSGAAMSLFQGTDTLANNLYISNIDQSSIQGGGALCISTAGFYIVNNTFYANSTQGRGGAVRSESAAGTLQLYNNIFYKNKGGLADDDVNNVTTAYTQANNSFSTVNPLFTNESDPDGADNTWATADDGLRLSSASPAANTGDNSKLPLFDTADITGAARVQQTTVNTGAYEEVVVTLTANLTGNTTVCENTAAPVISFIGHNGVKPFTFTYTVNGGPDQTVTTAGNSNTVTLPVPTGTPGQFIYLLKNLTDNAGSSAPQSKTATVIVNGPTATLASRNGLDSICYGTANVIVTTAAGGRLPYTYSLNGGAYQDTRQFTVSAGRYTVRIKDATGCIANTNSITLTQPAEKLAITGTQVTGADITVTATGGYGGYTYSLDGGAYSTSNTLTGVSAGIDTVRVHDQGGCIAAARVNILTATVIYDGGNNMVCYNRNKVITITPAGGVRPYRYTFDGNTAGRIMLAAPGTHTITVQDAASNSYSTGITIAAPAEKLNLTLAHTNATCAGGDGSITALPSGGYAGYTYSINGGSYAGENVFNNLDAGTYSVSAMDAAGCTSPVRTAIVKVPVNPCPGLRSGDEPTSSKGEMAGALVVKVMPNPAVVEFTLQVVSGDSKKVVEIRVMDMLGRTVYHTRGSVFDSYRFGRNFAGGMYIAEVLNGTSVQRVKLVKGN